VWHPFGVLAAALALVAAFAPPASAEHALQLSVDADEKGWIGLHVHGRPGTTVSIGEQVGDVVEPVSSVPLTSPNADRPRAVRWRCDRRTRRFLATAPGPFGAPESATAQVTTASCRTRLRAGVGRRARAGRRIAVRLRDHLGVGELPVSLCSRPPAGRRSCRKVAIPPGRRAMTARLRAFRPGRWRVEAQVAGGRRLRRKVRVRPRHGRLRMLATGDSMIQIVDTFLKQKIGGGGPARVRSDARISTGISKPGMFDWVAHARRQAAARPDVTVMFIGANDGFPIGGVSCCGDAWIDAYAGRVRKMMGTYKRGRAGVIYWLTLPTPRSGNFARVFRPVNEALRRAAAPFMEQVRLIDLRRTFTPDGRFHRTIRYRGRTIVARQEDGVHLSTAGASITASIIIRALKRDRIL
jgi:lysophospholipase L1-like esterase